MDCLTVRPFFCHLGHKVRHLPRPTRRFARSVKSRWPSEVNVRTTGELSTEKLKTNISLYPAACSVAGGGSGLITNGAPVHSAPVAAAQPPAAAAVPQKQEEKEEEEPVEEEDDAPVASPQRPTAAAAPAAPEASAAPASPAKPAPQLAAAAADEDDDDDLGLDDVDADVNADDIVSEEKGRYKFGALDRKLTRSYFPLIHRTKTTC